MRWILWGLLLLVSSCHWIAPEPTASKPRLVVVISYDQLRGDYLERWGHLLGERGFKRIQQEGWEYRQCHFANAATMTGPGHSVLLTGAYPARTGIVSNTFYDRLLAEEVYCVADSAFAVFGREGSSPGRSPRRLQVAALGDYLQQVSPKSKVISMAGKDRAAILLGGRRPDLALWFDNAAGLMTSSSYYTDTLPAWVQTWNAKHPAAIYSNQTWQLSLPESAYPMPDKHSWEGQLPGNGNTFPYHLPSYTPQTASTYLDAFNYMPFAVDYILQCGREAIEAEALGQDTLPDLLCLGISPPDAIGHTFGPDSRETLDMLVQCDRMLADFIDYLDARLGREKYLLALTSDHGVAPVPEFLQHQHPDPALNPDAGRIAYRPLRASIEEYLQATFPQGGRPWIRNFRLPHLILNDTTLQQAGVATSIVLDSLQAYLLTYPGIGIVVTFDELRTNQRPDYLSAEYFATLRQDFYPTRTGDLVIYPKTYWIFGKKATTHGTPYPYDTHIPLLFFGAGITPGSSDDLVSPADLAPTLGRFLDLSLPESDGRILPLL